MSVEQSVRLTKFAHGAGCGCKISPQVLDTILQTSSTEKFPALLVGNASKDDAAVYQLNEHEALISTTDFFTPVVDDAYMFGRVAACNALSDVYAMGGTPFMALAVLGWPVEKLPASLAQQVLEGARSVCNAAGVALAGGHSIDSPEPFFGLSVNGRVAFKNLKRNNTATVGNVILLTKPIGVGVLATAAKRDKLKNEHHATLHNLLLQLNGIGEKLGAVEAVTALTDVTGFGLLGHLIEMAEGSSLTAEISYSRLPVLAEAREYLAQNIIPDATYRNWNAYNAKLQLSAGVNTLEAFQILPDPQTNGGLLIAVAENALPQVQQLLVEQGYASHTMPIGSFISKGEKAVVVNP